MLQIQLVFLLTARTGGSHTLVCDSASDSGSNEMFHGTTYQWGYDLTNTGWNDDTYTLQLQSITEI